MDIKKKQDKKKTLIDVFYLFIINIIILFLHKRHENFSFFMFKECTRVKDIWKVLFMCIVLFSVLLHLQRMHKSHE